MTALQTLRQSTRLTMTVMAWFVLTLAAAVAAPMLPVGPDMVICSAAGQRTQPASDDAAAQVRLHCPLCLTHVAAATAPPCQGVAAMPMAAAQPRLDCGARFGAGTVTPLARAPPVVS